MKGKKIKHSFVHWDAIRCHVDYIRRTSSDPKRDVAQFKSYVRHMNKLQATVKIPEVMPT